MSGPRDPQPAVEGGPSPSHWWLDPALAQLAFGASVRAGKTASVSIASAMFNALQGADAATLDLEDPAQRAFGDYELLEQIGQGGMGMVFRARQQRLGREVAIKLLSAGAWAPEPLVDSLRREARHAAQLQHANIVTVFEMGEHEGLIFYAMQLVRGRSLSQQLDADGPLPARDAARLLRTIAEAVDYAHQLGVLHLDLKPGNILIEANHGDGAGAPLVTDFGLARRIEQALERDNISGTPSYMAPEQARTDGPALTPATDVWALGAVLYESLTGHPPFEGEDAAATVRLLLEAEVRKPSRYLSVPGDLEAICLKCLRKDPAQRYPDARALADDLGHYLEGREVSVRPLSAAQRLWRWARREPRVAGGLGFAVLSLVVGVFATSLQWQRADANARTASERLWETRREAAVRASMDGNGNDALPRLLANIQELEGAGDGDAALLDRRRFGMLAQQGVQLIDAIAVADANPMAVELSPDGSLLAIAYNDLSVRWYDTATLHERGRASLQGRKSADGGPRLPILLRFAGDSLLRVTLHWYDNQTSPTDGDSWLVDLRRAAVVEPPPGFADFADANFSDDGTLALLRDRRKRVQLWQVSPWQPRSPLIDPGGAGRVDDLSWLLGPRMVAMLPVAMLEMHLFRMPRLAAAGKLAMPNRVSVSAWNQSHDGHWIALGNFDGQLFLLDTRLRTLRTLPTARGREITWVEFSSDDAWLAACSYDGTAYAFDVASGEVLVSGQMRHDFILHRVGIDHGQRLLVAAGEGRVGLWRIPRAGPRASAAQRIDLAPAPHGLSGPYAASWSFRSGLLASAGIDGQVRLWRLPRPPSLPALAPRQIAEELEFDGQRIVDVEWHRLRLYSTSRGASSPWLELPQPPGFAELVDRGRTLLVTVGPSLRVYDVPSLRLRFAPIALPDSPQRLLASPDGGRVLLSFGGHGPVGFEDRLRQYDLRRGTRLAGDLALPGPLRQIAFSADGSRLLAVGPAEAATDVLAATRLGRLAQYPHDAFQPVTWAAFAPGRRDLLLATRAPDPRLGSDVLMDWDPDADAVRSERPLGAAQPLSVIAYGARTYVAGLGTDLLFNASGAARAAQRYTGTEATAVAALSPDARIVAHAFRREVQLVDARSGTAIGPPLQADINAIDVLQQLAFAPDGRSLLGRSLHGHWLLWPIAPDLRPTAQIAERLGYTQVQDDHPARLRALDAAKRNALRASDPGPWPAVEPRPPVTASHSANRHWQVGRPNLDRGPIPDRDPATPPQMLDLAAHYNRSPDGVEMPFYSVRAQLRPYPVGVQRIGGIDFDLRGVMDVSRNDDNVGNLPMGPRCIEIPAARVAAVHALVQSVIRQPTEVVTTIASLTWRYRDGSRARVPIRTLREVPGFSGRDQQVPEVFGISLASRYFGFRGETLSAPRLPNPQPGRAVDALCLSIPDDAEPLSVFALTLEGATKPPFVGKPAIAAAVSRNHH
ncbi:WD40 repeat domain-containing serine/threonine protein kinase [Luteimonas sp. 50]|uniref:WD40 repeat domain-containing serine/threonine protein kinase n=1 Tax=Cognatiluteimonas sedimenti TaxID=2927791 RepID=A0ABT0A3A7_9GAMM|nr:WD40 repeat domain-containing serine/threonine protein kinase [Lysobacter sedimenti]MCJ0825477.1 WD40 repeat domain-containing serine/threonine protein kinase [Lysobacter sedimenti]